MPMFPTLGLVLAIFSVTAKQYQHGRILSSSR
jgi:hypothetical protein